MTSIIEDQANRFQIIWDLGRRCSYSCSYCPPHRNNKWSPFVDLKALKKTMDSVHEYVSIYDAFRDEPTKRKLSFTGGEPTVHPHFFDFLKYLADTYPKYSRGLTTNGWFGEKMLARVKECTTTGTISYHCEATDKMKQTVVYNAIALKDNYKVNVMFHKDYFDECVKVCETFDKEKVTYIPRIIGDEGDSSRKEYDKKLGYAHDYNDEQMTWFRNYWKSKKQNVTNKGSDLKGLGRPCCGGRCFTADGNKETYFLPSTNFYGWSCMVNWYFLYLHSEADAVWTHQTCAVSTTGKVEPLGKISEFDKIIDDLEHNFYVKREIPIITCPKQYCGCGMCVTKAESYDLFKPMFDKATKFNLQSYPVEQQESSFFGDQTIRAVMLDVDKKLNVEN